ncbi:GNAT family N-acetyltransferase [Roseivirga misakiensis]|uniref:N-acetyltransferase domain-containing protein n=1 Tax=Roseivirga misakiensis TaxID=1563681 RepID=A0A1E5T5X6_9BACT|nr:GNAT family N-acetyltransferase [Roseivirga misakiensis]OEK06779.1 hypothetical protein BFP71_03715 [Roseivirga misakiensis]
MELVKCTEQYWEFVRILRQDQRVKEGFLDDITITPDMQKAYMADHSKFYRILLFEGQPAGYVGVIDNDIRVCTHPDFQGKGCGKFMIDEIMKIFPKAYARVKISNEASIRLFKSVGFTEKLIVLERN